MNRTKALIFVVKSSWQSILGTLSSLPTQYRNASRPDHCQSCKAPTTELHPVPRTSSHPGRGKWLCYACLYGKTHGEPGDPIPHQSTLKEALAFRPVASVDKRGHAKTISYKALLAKRSRMARRECEAIPPQRDLH